MPVVTARTSPAPRAGSIRWRATSRPRSTSTATRSAGRARSGRPSSSAATPCACLPCAGRRDRRRVRARGPAAAALVSWTTLPARTTPRATGAAIAEQGGTILYPAMDVGVIGRMLVAADPTGAVFGAPGYGLHRRGRGERARRAGLERANTADTDAAGRFYRLALGLRPATIQGMDGYSLNVGDRTVGACSRSPVPVGGHALALDAVLRWTTPTPPWTPWSRREAR